MRANNDFLLKIIVISVFSISSVLAGGNHGSAPKKKTQKQISAPISPIESDHTIFGKLIDTQYIDGFEVSAKIADVKDSVPDGGTHNILIKVKRGNKVQQNVEVVVDVLFPDNTRKSKTTLGIGDWSLAGFNLGQKGTHTILISFNNKNRLKHSAQMTYH